MSDIDTAVPAGQVITDAKGNKLEIAEMDPGDFFDLIEACAQNSTNRAWLAMAAMVCSVRSINGKPVPMPRNPDGVKNLARKIGSHGIAALQRAAAPDEDDEDAATPSAKREGLDVETVKN